MTIIKPAFRIFGAFRYHQPSGPLDMGWEAALPTAGNLLEISYAQLAPTEDWRAFARISRWDGGALPKLTEVLPDSEADNIFNADRYDHIVSTLKSPDPSLFWICEPSVGTPEKGHRLRLLDCVAFDQFEDEAEGEVTELSFSRFALRKEYQYGANDVGSAVTFGSSTDEGGIAALRLEFGFPMVSGLGMDEAALAMFNLYPTTRDAEQGAAASLVRPSDTFATAAGISASAKEATRRFGQLHFTPSRDRPRGHAPIDKATGGALPDHEGFVDALGLKDATPSRTNWIEFLGGPPGAGDKPTYSIAVRSSLSTSSGLPVFRAAQPTLEMGGFEAETIATCDLSDADLAKALNAPDTEISWQMHSALRWTTSQPLDSGAFVANAPDDSPFKGGGLQEAVRLSHAAREGLVATTRQPQSILPDLTFSGGGSSQEIPLIAYAAADHFLVCGALGDAVTMVLAKDAPSEDAAPLGLRVTLDTIRQGDDVDQLHAPAMRSWQHAPAPKDHLQLQLGLPLLMDRADPATRGDDFPVIFAHHPGARTAGANPAQIMFRVDNSDSAMEGSRLSARLGSLQLTGTEQQLLRASSDPNIVTSQLILRSADRPTPDPLQDAKNTPRLDVEWQLDFSLEAAQPVTVDIRHGDRDERPTDLLIQEGARDATSEDNGQTTALHMKLSERLRDDQDRHLQGELRDVSAGTSVRRDVTVLSDLPFSVYRYSRQAFEDAGGEDSSLVATYDSDQRQWRRRQSSETYLMMRPPGALGEDADKPGMLELHDPDPERDPEHPLRPTLPPENGVARRVALDMRLAPPSALWIKPTDLERNFVLPEYAGRDLFRQRGDFGLGVQMAALRSEALYGLALGILVPPATRARPTPRVAEIEALVGRMSPPRIASDGSQEIRWRALYETFRKRPENLEFWTLDASARVPFVRAHFDEGARFTLRRTAVMAPPINDARIEPTNRGGPIQPPRFAEHGLAGGALWPVESANLVRNLAETSVADGGTLDGVALSPIGISADQSVSFLDGRVKILSETREGRLHKQRVEVLGRIGALWHRAKHVVIYERTTAPSDQFAPNLPGTRTGRAVLRKVREFVEILEPVRRYPDVAGVTAETSGFVSAVRFNSRIINVNSAWGGDVGRFGWQVPLWNRGAAEERPQVYPHPDIAFVTRAEGRRDGTETTQDCRDPHLIYFYTETDADASADTDLWPVRNGIDCTILSRPEIQLDGEMSVKAQADKDLISGNLARRAAPSRVPFGMRRFTWRLAPSPVRTQINAERGEKPIFAGVESVTFMRDFELRADYEIAADPSLGDFQNTLEKAVETPALPAGLVLPRPIGDALSQVAPGLPRINELAAAIGDPKLSDDDRKTMAAELVGLIDAHRPTTDVAKEVVDLVLDADTITKLSELADTLKDNTVVDRLTVLDEEDCEQLAQRAATALKRRKLLVLQTIRETETRLLTEIDMRLAAGNFPSKEAVKQQLREEIEVEIGGLTGDLVTSIGGVADGVAVARSTVADWRADVLAALTRAKARVDEAANAIDRLKPWSRNRLEQALAQLDRVYDDAEREAEAALAEARQRMATEIGGAARSVSGVVAASIASVIRAKKETLQITNTIERHVQEQADRIVATARKIPAPDDPQIVKIKAQVEKSGNDTVKGAFKAAETGLATVLDFRNEIATEVESLRNVATGSLAQIETSAATVANQVIAQAVQVDTAVRALEAFLTAIAEQSVDDIKLATDMLKGDIEGLKIKFQSYAREVLDVWHEEVDVLDDAVDAYAERITDRITQVENAAAAGFGAADQWLRRFEFTTRQAQTEVPAALEGAVVNQVVEPALEAAFDAVIWPNSNDEAPVKAAAERAVRGVADRAEDHLNNLDQLAEEGLKEAKEACKVLMGAKQRLLEGATNLVDEYAGALASELQPQLDALKELGKTLDAVKDDAEEILKLADSLETTAEDFTDAVEGIGTEIASATEHARSYFTGGLEQAGDIFDAKPEAIPGKALELISFLSHSPEIANIKTNADRARMYVDKAKKALSTPEVKATLDYLGDALKALGLEFDFEDITDAFEMKLPSSFNLSNLIPSFGGIDLRNLLPQTSVGSDFKKYVELTHDLDTKAGRAWVQADVNAPLAGREALFTIGPFTLFVTQSHLTAFLRAEASKDSPDVTVTDRASLKTDLEAVVGGQVLVTLKEVLITYSRDTDLDFEIDPRKIRIHKAMQFVQDTFGSIFGDEDNGLTFLRDGATVVGVQHTFSLPPMSLNYATSGISNIAISNRFALRAFPDFKISNQFNLSRRELPFIFSIFIIGGTGYVQVDTDYLPVDRSLVVAVEAGLGGSAALAFSFGPVSGGVYITLSIVLRYVKRIGSPEQSDDGLSVSLVLVIAGNVSLWGIVTIYLGLMLSMTYHESGRIDAKGSLSVEVRISRWFKLKYSTQVTYKLRDGRSTTTRTEELSTSGKAADAFKKLDDLNNARKSL
ncbi:hypothetical protein [Roseibium album]|uniref:hypothetical protein n=1 Tax=Roseibium album TaxID=311410 RepID=UPI00329984E5